MNTPTRTTAPESLPPPSSVNNVAPMEAVLGILIATLACFVAGWSAWDLHPEVFRSAVKVGALCAICATCTGTAVAIWYHHKS